MGKRRTLPAYALLTFVLLVAVSPGGAQDNRSGEYSDEYRYYVATVAAADGFLQLHDIVAVRHWLREAPASQRGWEWSYLHATADRSAGSFTAHDGTVTDLSVSPDGTLLATTGGNETVMWDVATAARVGALSGHTRSAWNARFSPDGQRVATVGSDGTLRIWARATGEEQVRAEDVGSGVSGVAWHPGGEQVATVSWKRSSERGVWGVVDIWHAGTGERLHHLEHGDKPIASVNYTPDGSQLYIGTWDFDVGVYDTGTWTPVRHLVPPEDGVYKAVFESRLNPDGSLLAVAHADGAVRIWDAESGQLMQVLHRQAEGARLSQHDVEWFPDGRRLAAVSSDLTLRIWDAVTGDHLQTLHGHTSRITSVAVTPDGMTLFTGDASGEVRRWDLTRVSPERHRWQLPDVGYSVAVSHDGRRVASTGWTGWIVIFDQKSGRELVRWEGHGTSGVRAAWSPDDQLLATTGNDGMVKVWDTRGDPPNLVLERPVETQSLAVAFSRDGRYLASPAAGPSLAVWSVTDGGAAGSLSEEVAFSDLAWHPTDPTLALAGADGVVRLWDAGSRRVSHRLTGNGGGQLQVAFSPDGTVLATASSSGAVRIWDLATRTLQREMSIRTGGQIAVAFSPDGRRLATGGSDNSVHIWDPSTGVHLLKVPFAESLWEVAWSNDGNRLLVIPLDGTIRVLDAGSATPSGGR